MVEGGAGVWEGWSSFDAIEVSTLQPTYYRNTPGIGDYLVVPLVLDRHYRDTFSVRLGGSYQPLDWLVLRAGGYYETGATPDAYFTVASADADKGGIALGVGFSFSAFEIDAGYLHVFVADQDIPVSESRARQTNPTNPEGSVTIGGGKYRSAYEVFGISVLVRVSDWF